MDMNETANLVFDLSVRNKIAIAADVLPILVQKNDYVFIAKLINNDKTKLSDVVNNYLSYFKTDGLKQGVKNSLRHFMSRDDFTITNEFLKEMAGSSNSFLLYETFKHATKGQLEQFFAHKGIKDDEQKKLWIKTHKERLVAELKNDLKNMTEEQRRGLLNDTLGLRGVHGENELKSNNNALVAVLATHTGHGFSFNVQTSKGTKLFSQSTKSIEDVLHARDVLNQAATSQSPKPK
jgi:hypothetical protein